MGNLAFYLQRAFAAQADDGWECRSECRLLDEELATLLGYAPRADVILVRPGTSHRIWVEFEVSRADPVANHAKFATAHLFRPFPETDTFVSMVSSHVARGRRNLAANTIHVLREIGLNAFQTILLPTCSPAIIKQLNYMPALELEMRLPPSIIAREINRVLSLAQDVIELPSKRVFFVGDYIEILLNIRRWNEEVATKRGEQLWGKRTVRYFVFDRSSRRFAPTKFCAYSVAKVGEVVSTNRHSVPDSQMSIEVYVTLDETEPKFDGTKARTHLENRLGLQKDKLGDLPEAVQEEFEKWREQHRDTIRIHPSGPQILQVPSWYS